MILEHIRLLNLNMAHFCYVIYVFVCGTVLEFPKYKIEDWICPPPLPLSLPTEIAPLLCSRIVFIQTYIVLVVNLM